MSKLQTRGGLRGDPGFRVNAGGTLRQAQGNRARAPCVQVANAASILHSSENGFRRVAPWRVIGGKMRGDGYLVFKDRAARI